MGGMITQSSMINEAVLADRYLLMSLSAGLALRYDDLGINHQA